MTVEELAVRIAAGDADELTPILWEKVRRYFYLQAGKHFEAHRTQYEARGLTSEDARQESYIAFVEAVKAYGRRPPKYAEIRFFAFARLQVKRRGGELIGRTKANQGEPLNQLPLSLDEPIKDKDGDTNTTRGELLEDLAALLPFEEVENATERETIRQEVTKSLESRPKLHNAISLIYYDGLTQIEAAEHLNCARSYIHSLLYDAYRLLRRNKTLQQIAHAQSYYRHVGVDSFERYGSIEERLLEQQERLEPFIILLKEGKAARK